MSQKSSRRRFLKSSAALGGAALGAGLGPEFGFLARLPRVRADEIEGAKVVALDQGIEDLVELIETSPRSELLERMAKKVHAGRSFREVVAAVFLAAIRNVQPRPSVGFKFHAVLVVNSALEASLHSPESDRWLPIFWALDEFKGSQADEIRRGGWRMPPVDESAVPPAHRARTEFIQAMESWDEAKADAAVAGLVRTAGASEIYELFFRYGARDFRSIGHKAIFVANSWRTLQFIGWQHAEPVLRSLTYALLNHGLPDGRTPATSDDAADRPWRKNLERVKTWTPEWKSGRTEDGATRDLISALHGASADEVCELAAKLIKKGVAPQSLHDALLVGSGELLYRQPGIVALHAVTTTNALRYAFATAANDETRRLLLLQNCAFLPLFREAMGGRGEVRPTSLDDLEPVSLEKSGSAALEEIFADASGDRLRAAGKAKRYLQDGGSAAALMTEARRLLFLKGNDHHDYKFATAVLEDYYRISPPWRDAFLASSLFRLEGSRQKDNALVERTRSVLAV